MDTLKFVFEESDIGMGQNLVLAIKITGIDGSSSPKILFICIYTMRGPQDS